MQKSRKTNLYKEINLLLKDAIERDEDSCHVDDLHRSFRGVSNWLHGALESFQVAIEVCQTCDTPITIAMDFFLETNIQLSKKGVSTLEELENAFDHSITGSPPELYILLADGKTPPVIRQGVPINSLPILFPGIEWFYILYVDEFGDSYHNVFMILDIQPVEHQIASSV